MRARMWVLCVGGRAATAPRVPRMKITVRAGVRS
jgi:hypothetical protein